MCPFFWERCPSVASNPSGLGRLHICRLMSRSALLSPRVKTVLNSLSTAGLLLGVAHHFTLSTFSSELPGDFLPFWWILKWCFNDMIFLWSLVRFILVINLVLYLLDFQISPFVKCLLIYFVLFLFWGLTIFLLICRSPLYVLHADPFLVFTPAPHLFVDCSAL